MRREPVTSKAMVAIGYDDTEQVLEIEFKGGRVYRYQDVPPSVHAWLLRSPDKGGLFNRLVRDQYAERDVTPAAVQPDLSALLLGSLSGSEEE